MVFVVLFHTLATFVYLFMGIRFLVLDRRSQRNRNFFYTCTAFALWSGGYIFLNSPHDPGLTSLIERLAHTGANIYYIFSFRFILFLTGYNKKIVRPVLFWSVFMIAPCLLMFLNWRYNTLVTMEPAPVFLVGAHVYANLVNLATMAIAAHWAIKSRQKKARIHAFWIILGSFVSMILTLLSDFLLTETGIRTLSPSIVILWMFAIFYVMVKYRFVGLTPAVVNQDILSHIEDSVALLDFEGMIIWGNPSMQKRLSCPPEEQICFFDLLADADRIRESFMQTSRKKIQSFSCKASLSLLSEKQVLMELKFSRIRDRFDDPVGILLIGKEIREIRQLKVFYGVTPREVLVIQQVFDGKSNFEIAGELGITERTVKSHLTNIYNKLGISSKTQLMNRLIDYQIVPQASAERRLLNFKLFDRG